MDAIDIALLRAMTTASIGKDDIHASRIDALVAAGLVVEIQRQKLAPNHPEPPPVYRLSQQGEEYVASLD